MKSCWTNAMDVFLKENFGKVDSKTLKEQLGADFPDIRKKVRSLKLDRDGKEVFTLEELNELSALVADQYSFADLCEYFKDKTKMSIYAQVEALKQWNNLPDYTPRQQGDNKTYAWTEEEENFLKEAIIRGDSPDNVFLPMRTNNAIRQRFNIIRRAYEASEKEVSRVLKEVNKKQIKVEPKPEEKAVGPKEIERKEPVEYHVVCKNSAGQLTILKTTACKRYAMGFKDAFDHKMNVILMEGTLTRI
jgi:hypothetical protein